jgi:hypothetical protein
MSSSLQDDEEGATHHGIAWTAFLDVALRGKPAKGLENALDYADEDVALALDDARIATTRSDTADVIRPAERSHPLSAALPAPWP